jgi:dimethylhistidine N-methyltransferase
VQRREARRIFLLKGEKEKGQHIMAAAVESQSTLRDDVLAAALQGLAVPAGKQKTLPPWLFYDQAGSALFEQITRLPEYYLTEAERSIFAARAGDIVARDGSSITIAELGSGTASKTGLLLSAAARRQPDLLYQPIDVSASALQEAVESLPAIVPNLRVQPQIANYVSNGYTITRPDGCSILTLYIGSSIGNFGPDEARSILRKLKKHLNKLGDALLLGVDLAPCPAKPLEVVLAAYDDPQGVTAAFNKNILVRLNREIGTNFNVDAFQHRASWNAPESRIEMHLESTVAQTVTMADRQIGFAAGETIHTENSYKFTERSLRELLSDSGYGSPQWFEDERHYFGEALAFPA